MKYSYAYITSATPADRDGEISAWGDPYLNLEVRTIHILGKLSHLEFVCELVQQTHPF